MITAAGLATLHRQGMAAWIKIMSTTPTPTPGRPAYRPPAPCVPAANELAVLIASLVATLVAEPTHA